MDFDQEANLMLQRLETLIEPSQYDQVQHWAETMALAAHRPQMQVMHISEAMVYVLTPERLSEIESLEYPSKRIEQARALGVPLPEDPEPWRLKCNGLLESIEPVRRQVLFIDLAERYCPSYLMDLSVTVYCTSQLKAICQNLESLYEKPVQV